jgi:hypothetical protein
MSDRDQSAEAGHDGSVPPMLIGPAAGGPAANPDDAARWGPSGGTPAADAGSSPAVPAPAPVSWPAAQLALPSGPAPTSAPPWPAAAGRPAAATGPAVAGPPALAAGAPDPFAPAHSAAGRWGHPALALSALLAVAALLAGSVFAFRSAAAAEGSDNPEAAVQAFFAALDREDLTGVLETLPPGERRAVREPLTELSAELERLGILSSFTQTSVPGVDLHVSGLALTTEPAGGSADAAVVAVTGGTVAADIDAAALPLSAAARRALVDPSSGTASDSHDLAGAGLRLATVRVDGRWHVSLLATPAIAGDEAGAAAGPAPAPVGAATPEAVLPQVVRAALDLDGTGVLVRSDPDELAGVYAHAGTILPRLQPGADRLRADGYRATVNRLDVRVEGDGDVRRVVPTAADVDITVGSGEHAGTVHATYDGRCWRQTTTGAAAGEAGTRTFDSCQPLAGIDDLRPWGSGLEGLDKLPGLDQLPGLDRLPGLGGGGRGSTTTTTPPAPGPDDAPRVTVVQRGGRWYLSPTRTVLDGAVRSLRRVDPADVDRALTMWGMLRSFGGSSLLGGAGRSGGGELIPGLPRPGGS